MKNNWFAWAVVASIGLTWGGSEVVAQGRWVLSSTPLQQRQTGVTETVGDIVLSAANPEAFIISAGTILSVTIVPAAAAIMNDPIVNGVNVLLNGAPVPNALLRVE